METHIDRISEDPEVCVMHSARGAAMRPRTLPLHARSLGRGGEDHVVQMNPRSEPRCVHTSSDWTLALPASTQGFLQDYGTRTLL